MGFAVDRVAVLATGWTALDTSADDDRNAGGSPMAGQGLAIKNTGSVQILLDDGRAVANKQWPLDPGEVFTVDLDRGDHLFGQAVGSAGSVAVAQVGVKVPT